MIRVISPLLFCLFLFACNQDQSAFLRNLTKDAQNGLLDKPFIGSKEQVETIAKVIAGISEYSSIVILGEVGSGKKAIVEEVARLCSGLSVNKYPELKKINLTNQIIVYFNVEKLAKSYGCKKITIKQFGNELKKIQNKFGKKTVISISKLSLVIYNDKKNKTIDDKSLFVKNLLRDNNIILIADPYDIDIIDEDLASFVEVTTPVNWGKDDFRKIFNVWKNYLSQKRNIIFNKHVFIDSEKSTGNSYMIVSLLNGAINEAKKKILEKDSNGRIIVKREHVERYYS